VAYTHNNFNSEHTHTLDLYILLIS